LMIHWSSLSWIFSCQDWSEISIRSTLA
jgi:hypothetical protein